MPLNPTDFGRPGISPMLVSAPSGSFGKTNNVLRTAANLLQITLEMLVTVRNRLSRDNSESYSQVSNSYLNNIAIETPALINCDT